MYQRGKLEGCKNQNLCYNQIEAVSLLSAYATFKLSTKVYGYSLSFFNIPDARKGIGFFAFKRDIFACEGNPLHGKLFCTNATNDSVQNCNDSTMGIRQRVNVGKVWSVPAWLTGSNQTVQNELVLPVMYKVLKATVTRVELFYSFLKDIISAKVGTFVFQAQVLRVV